MRLVTFEMTNSRRWAKKYPYIVRFNAADPATKPFFNNFTQLIGDVSARYDLTQQGWLVSQSGMEAFYALDSRLFSTTIKTAVRKYETTKEKMSHLIDIKSTAVQGAESMGSMMKLQPYPYQKEIIKFCLDAKTALIVSPCGSGRLSA